MNIVALTGAGVSRASGVPTFEEMGDLRDKLSRWYFDYNPQAFYEILIKMKDTIDGAAPNPAHLALAKYHIPIVTMNIDGLHHRAGSTEEEAIEIHGSLRKVYCPSCGCFYDFDQVRRGITCPVDNTLLQPDVVLYGDSIPRLQDALELVAGADRLVVIGTSFYTSTASYVTDAAKKRGIPVDVINEAAETELPAYMEHYLGGSNHG